MFLEPSWFARWGADVALSLSHVCGRRLKRSMRERLEFVIAVSLRHPLTLVTSSYNKSACAPTRWTAHLRRQRRRYSPAVPLAPGNQGPVEAGLVAPSTRAGSNHRDDRSSADSISDRIDHAISSTG